MMKIKDIQITRNEFKGKYNVSYDTEHIINMENGKLMSKQEIIKLLEECLEE